jgi:hypothetical protein
MATPEQLETLATFGASYVVLTVGHTLADHLFGQTDWQASNKAAPTPEEVVGGARKHRGWAANLAHVALYHLTLVALGLLAWLALPLWWSLSGVVAALVWSIVTHAFVDRRWPVRWLLKKTGNEEFATPKLGGLNGVYLADQALHTLALAIAAGMLALIP